MDHLSSARFTLLQSMVIGLIMVVSILCVNLDGVYAHGGKKHSGSDFSAFQALQKAVDIYGKLIVSGKLKETWETTLQNVEVVAREENGSKEYRVSFQRAEGSPSVVYIFFSANGEYAGSNFEGD